MDDESGSCSGSGNSGPGSLIVGPDRKRVKLGEEEMGLDEAIAEIVAVIDDQSKMLGRSLLYLTKDIRRDIMTGPPKLCTKVGVPI